ncbi:MAG: hypothetical protein ABSC94_17215 [Polyangiaceae bacterium]|jgi:hypothetical protein
MKRLLALGLTAAVLAATPRSYAQEYLLGASASISSGAEGGSVGLYRARTRLRLGTDLRVDEFPDDILEIGLLAELEPRSAFGADVRYAHAAGKHFVVDVGALGILAPLSLYGVCASLTYRIPMSKTVQITLGPEGDFYFLGTDLPDGTVIWEMRFQGGLRVEL